MQVLIRYKNNGATFTAIPTVRAPFGNKLFPPKSNSASAALSTCTRYFSVIDKHNEPKKKRCLKSRTFFSEFYGL
jgi:hypothetical protein